MLWYLLSSGSCHERKENDTLTFARKRPTNSTVVGSTWWIPIYATQIYITSQDCGTESTVSPCFLETNLFYRTVKRVWPRESIEFSCYSFAYCAVRFVRASRGYSQSGTFLRINSCDRQDPGRFVLSLCRRRSYHAGQSRQLVTTTSMVGQLTDRWHTSYVTNKFVDRNPTLTEFLLRKTATGQKAVHSRLRWEGCASWMRYPGREGSVVMDRFEELKQRGMLLLKF